MPFRNPILPGFNPDPSICSVPGLGYFVCTSSFEYWPGLPIYHSKDLVNWKLIGHAINRKSQLDMRTVEESAGLWAPTIRYNQGRFYVACGATYRFRLDYASKSMDIVMPRGFHVSTTDIFNDAAWSDPVYFDELGLDQDLFFDDDSKTYLSVSRKITDPDVVPVTFHHGTYACEIDVETGESLSPSVLLRHSHTGTSEGSHIFKLDGWYYLFSAEGGTEANHQQWVFRSRNVLGPYEAPPKGVNPILYNGDHPDIRNTGHMDLVETPTGWMAVFLGIRPQEGREGANESGAMPTQLGREGFMARVEWVDGWPVVNGGKEVELEMQADGVGYAEEVESWRDGFDGDKLDIGWYSLRTPVKPFHLLTPHGLALKPSPYRLDTHEESLSMLVRKQTAFSMDWTVEVEFEPKSPGHEAGAVVWDGRGKHASLGVTVMREGGRVLVFRKPVESGRVGFDTTTIPLDNTDSLILHIEARPDSYRFLYASSSSPSVTHLVGSVKAETMTPLFTGTHIGIYAEGSEGRGGMELAYFREVGWRVVKEGSESSVDGNGSGNGVVE